MGCRRCYAVFLGELAGCHGTSLQEAGGNCSKYGAMEAGSAFTFNLTIILVLWVLEGVRISLIYMSCFNVGG